MPDNTPKYDHDAKVDDRVDHDIAEREDYSAPRRVNPQAQQFSDYNDDNTVGIYLDEDSDGQGSFGDEIEESPGNDSGLDQDGVPVNVVDDSIHGSGPTETEIADADSGEGDCLISSEIEYFFVESTIITDQTGQPSDPDNGHEIPAIRYAVPILKSLNDHEKYLFWKVVLNERPADGIFIARELSKFKEQLGKYPDLHEMDRDDLVDFVTYRESFISHLLNDKSIFISPSDRFSLEKELDEIRELREQVEIEYPRPLRAGGMVIVGGGAAATESGALSKEGIVLVLLGLAVIVADEVANQERDEQAAELLRGRIRRSLKPLSEWAEVIQPLPMDVTTAPPAPPFPGWHPGLDGVQDQPDLPRPPPPIGWAGHELGKDTPQQEPPPGPEPDPSGNKAPEPGRLPPIGVGIAAGASLYGDAERDNWVELPSSETEPQIFPPDGSQQEKIQSPGYSPDNWVSLPPAIKKEVIREPDEADTSKIILAEEETTSVEEVSSENILNSEYFTSLGITADPGVLEKKIDDIDRPSTEVELRLAVYLKSIGHEVHMLDEKIDTDSKTPDYHINSSFFADAKRVSGLGRHAAKDAAKGCRQVGSGGTVYVVRPASARQSLDSFKDFYIKFRSHVDDVTIEVLDEDSLPSLPRR